MINSFLKDAAEEEGGKRNMGRYILYFVAKERVRSIALDEDLNQRVGFGWLRENNGFVLRRTAEVALVPILSFAARKACDKNGIRFAYALCVDLTGNAFLQLDHLL